MDCVVREESESKVGAPQFKKAPCDYCGHEMRFQAEAEGENAECPNCGRVVCLGAVAITPRMFESAPVGDRLRKCDHPKNRRHLRIAGWVLFVVSIVTLATLALTPFAPGQTVARLLTLGAALTISGVGLVMMIEGGRPVIYWECSACGQKLTAWNDIVCGACHVDLR